LGAIRRRHHLAAMDGHRLPANRMITPTPRITAAAHAAGGASTCRDIGCAALAPVSVRTISGTPTAAGRIRATLAIASTLVLTIGAVEKHIASIFSKLTPPPSESDHRRCWPSSLTSSKTWPKDGRTLPDDYASTRSRRRSRSVASS
jgi:hypothetical protein